MCKGVWAFRVDPRPMGPKFLAVPAYNCMKFNVDVRWVRAAASIAMSGPIVEGEVSLLWYVPHQLEWSF